MADTNRGSNPQGSMHRAGTGQTGGQGGQTGQTGATGPTGQPGQGQGGTGDTLKGLGASAQEAVGQVREKVADVASGVANRLGDAWESTRQGLTQGGEWVSETAGDAWQRFAGTIRRYPVASVAIAFGAGCLFASLLSLSSFRSDDMARRMSRYSS
jgi:hypothetical protein